MTSDDHRYRTISRSINNRIASAAADPDRERDHDCPDLRRNQHVRNYAEKVYQANGLNDKEVTARMARKEAGHIQAKNRGGLNETDNYMWEDRRDNRAHHDEPVSQETLRMSGRNPAGAAQSARTSYASGPSSATSYHPPSEDAGVPWVAAAAVGAAALVGAFLFSSQTDTARRRSDA